MNPLLASETRRYQLAASGEEVLCFTVLSEQRGERRRRRRSRRRWRPCRLPPVDSPVSPRRGGSGGSAYSRPREFSHCPRVIPTAGRHRPNGIRQTTAGSAMTTTGAPVTHNTWQRHDNHRGPLTHNTWQCHDNHRGPVTHNAW